MGITDKKKRFEQVVKRMDKDWKLLGVRELEGGVSARVTLMEIVLPDGCLKRILVRQHGSIDLNRNPRVASDEYRLLRILKNEGLSAPEPYYLDETGEVFPDPYIVIEYFEGKSESKPDNLRGYFKQLAEGLAKLHKVDCSKVDISFLPKQEKNYSAALVKAPEKLDDSLSEGLIRSTLKAVWPLAGRNKEVILHGDFWPGNTLWRNGRLIAIIDWEDACFGDPLADVSNARLEILWAFGEEAMEMFTGEYKSIMPAVDFSYLPYWDLCAALRPASKLSQWGLDPEVERDMRDKHSLFVAQAVDRISC